MIRIYNDRAGYAIEDGSTLHWTATYDYVAEFVADAQHHDKIIIWDITDKERQGIEHLVQNINDSKDNRR